MLLPKDSTAFTDTLADVLRLYEAPTSSVYPANINPSPDETLAMSYIYLNKYTRFQKSSTAPDPLDSYVCLPLPSNPKRPAPHR